MPIPLFGKLQSGTGTPYADAEFVEVSSTGKSGLLVGAANAEVALTRLDSTGVGAPIFTFTGSYSMQSSNINEWFGGRMLVRLRCIDSGTGIGVSGAVPVTLAGATALNTAFDTLVANGLPEIITFIIEYTGAADDFVQISPRVSPSPQIGGTTSIIVRTGIAATLEITRSSGTISDYVFQSIGASDSSAGGASPDSLKLINPANATWDATENATLPSTGVVKGNAYRVVNAPLDGSGRFGEVMQTDDWVVWNGESFTSWSAEPHAWFVLPAHDVRRITALEADYLSDFQETPVSNRNTVIRGADYADTAGELRLKIYTAESGTGSYTAADLNTTGDIDEYSNTSDITGTLAIRLDNTDANQDPPTTDLFVYAENSDGTFVLIGNMARDFAFRGNFGAEADYTSNSQVVYTTGQTIRIYIGQTEERYNNPNLDVIFDNLSSDVQQLLNNHSGDTTDIEQRITSLEGKVDNLFPLTPDVSELTEIASVIDTEQTTEEVIVTAGYTLMADYRGDSTRYEQAGVTYDNSGSNVARYTGLSDDLHRAFGFKVTAPADQILLWIVDGSELTPVIDMTAAGNFRVNNYLRETNAGDVVTNEFHTLTLTSGSGTLSPNEANVATYTLTNFPTGSTATRRTFEFDADFLVNGSDTLAAHGFIIPAPTTNTAQARTTVDGVGNLGPLHQNRQVPITVSHEYRVSGENLLVDVRLVTAPSDITIRLDSVNTLLDYTAASTTTRNDRWLILNDASGDLVFTGEAELLIHAQPLADGNTVDWVPVVRRSDGTVDQLNNSTTALPHATFDSVEIPDTIDFRTFEPDTWLRHSELAAIVQRTNTQWVYGFAALRSVSELQINEQVEFPQGIVLVAPDSSRHKLTVANDGTLKTEVVT